MGWYLLWDWFILPWLVVMMNVFHRLVNYVSLLEKYLFRSIAYTLTYLDSFFLLIFGIIYSGYHSPVRCIFNKSFLHIFHWGIYAFVSYSCPKHLLMSIYNCFIFSIYFYHPPWIDFNNLCELGVSECDHLFSQGCLLKMLNSFLQCMILGLCQKLVGKDVRICFQVHYYVP